MGLKFNAFATTFRVDPEDLRIGALMSKLLDDQLGGRFSLARLDLPKDPDPMRLEEAIRHSRLEIMDPQPGPPGTFTPFVVLDQVGGEVKAIMIREGGRYRNLRDVVAESHEAKSLRAQVQSLQAENAVLRQGQDNVARELNILHQAVAEKLKAENAELRRQLETPPVPSTPALTVEEAEALATLNRAMDQAEALGLNGTLIRACSNDSTTDGLNHARHAIIAKFRDRVLDRPRRAK